MVAGFPFSKVLMSISQFVLLGNWLWEGDLGNKLKMFRHNKAALILFSLPLLYVSGLLWSTDINYALNDIRIKLPLFVLPLIFSTSQVLSEKRFRLLMNIFSFAVVASTLVSVAAYYGLTNKAIKNQRDISVFMSHIRFSLLICVAILFLLYSAIVTQEKKWGQRVQFAGAAWLIFFLFFLESMTGLVALFISSLVALLIFSVRQKSFILKLFYASGVLLIAVFSLVLIFREVTDFYKIKSVDFSLLEEYSANGERYIHDTLKKNFENGNLIWIYFAPHELEQAWNGRSRIKFNEKDQRGQPISYTLMRFLTSKDFRKDAPAVQKLSDEEVMAVERGDANVNYLQHGIRTRINQTIWEINNYLNGENPQGNSITQRLEFWKAAIGSFALNPVFGAGTGDLQHAMDFQFSEMKTLLGRQYWLKPHNQYLTITVAFGLFGLIWFLVFLIVPGITRKSWGSFFYTSFMVIALLSMLTEDTLDNQVGISFFAFFSCLFLFGKED